MTFRKTAAHFLFIFALSFAACDRVPTPRNATQSAPPKTTTYAVNGVLREVSADRRKAVIAHEAIPGYMEAMTMEFDVHDSVLPNGLEPGDRVAFRLSVTETKSWIDRVRKLGSTAEPRPAVTAPVIPNAASTQIGMLLPDCALIDQRGRAFRLSDLKGKALAITFIFTRCPLPNFCPLMNRHFAEVQRALKDEPTLSDWHLVSVTFDPEYDTSERLAKYAEFYEPDPAHWTFAGGELAAIQQLGSAVGLSVSNQGGPLDHNLRTVVVDAAGRVQKVFAGNEWKPRELLDEMKRAMAAQP
jgi:protein SCO1/2